MLGTILSIYGMAKDGLQAVSSIWGFAKEWWSFKRPAAKVLGQMIKNDTPLRIFVKDLIVPENTNDAIKLFSVEGSNIMGHPNITAVWPEVDAKGVGTVQNLLGQLGKRKNIEVIEMSKGYNLWDSDFIIFGAQAMKNVEFYELMENVGYSADEKHIYDKQSNQPITMEPGYGYGLIIKAEKDDIKGGGKKYGILLGGFGTLGTEAAIYYFCNAIHLLGREFEGNCFSLVVRARVNSGIQSTKRLNALDKVYKSTGKSLAVKAGL